MNPFTWIDRYLKEHYTKEERFQIDSLRSRLVERDQKITDLLKDNASINTDVKICNESLDKFKAVMGLDVRKPSWLNTDILAYPPQVLYPDRDGGHKVVHVDQRDMYGVSWSMDLLVKQRGWSKMSRDEALMEIWKYTTAITSYYSDWSGENWNYPATTLKAGHGDCEDTTILFVGFCRAAGIPANHVFNAVGTVYNEKEDKTFVHSWPIALMENNKWYIYESTLWTKPTAPKLFKGSNYKADRGVSNWRLTGVINNSSKQV